MAIYHLHATPIQRSKGHSAVAAAAYRAGEKLRDRQEGLTHDYSRKHGVVQSEILAPDHAPEWVNNREELWNRAELAEKRRDGQPAREIRVALPNELDDEQRAELVFTFCREVFVGAGIVADVSIHRPDRHGDERNHHAHILLTMRELDGDAFAARKQRDWNREETLHGWREQWAQYQNRALEEAGYHARVDHRTLEAQGIDREPTTHMGKAATAMERRGEQTERGNNQRQIETKNHMMDRLKSERAELDAAIAAEIARSLPQPEPELQAAQPVSVAEQRTAAEAAFSERWWGPQQRTAEPPLNQEEHQRAAEVSFVQRWWGQEPEQRTVEASLSGAERKHAAAVAFLKRWWGQQPEQQETAPPSLEERKWTAEAAFVQRWWGKTQESQAEPVSLVERTQAAADALYRSVGESYSRMVKQAGEVKAYDLGRTWVDRSVAFLENIYYNTVGSIRTGLRNTVGRYVSPTLDVEVERDE